LALTAGRSACRKVTWRKGSKQSKDNPTAAMRSPFLAIRIRPASRHIPRQPDASLPDEWLIADWPPDKPEPVKYWLSTLPSHTPLKTLWSALGFAESRFWISCHDGCVLELYRGQHADAAVAALSVVEDLQVVEDRVGEFDSSAPAVAIE
jgi:hypothetical protein